jgi:hypothetical protein
MSVRMVRMIRVRSPVGLALGDMTSPGLSEHVLLEPGQGGVGDVAPAAVDREGVRAVGEFLDVGDRVGMPVLLEGGSCQRT